ncbi:NAD(P)H-dependent oxidoreductase [Pseudomonas aeruginosa]|uniref:NAD(P)H-dependent oxidoreductase n=1 Tax=Pseudomonas aeruginosa TaxID=287 RepID=UPI0039C705DC
MSRTFRWKRQRSQNWRSGETGWATAALLMAVPPRSGWPLPAPAWPVSAGALGATLARNQAPAELQAVLDEIESADLLLVASPVYRGSYPGLLKHLFDLIDLNALIDTPVLLAATGGTERHALVLDHQLRPLFSFFQAITLPIGVYASEADFDNYRIVSELLKARIRLAAERAAPLFGGRSELLKIA